MNLDFINRLLAALPSYANVRLAIRGRDFDFVVRELPGPNRRLTCTSTGTEWFLPLRDDLGVEMLVIDRLAVSVIG